MLYRLAFPLLSAVCASLVLAAAAAAPVSPLAAERWSKRVVLIFAAEDGSTLKAQADALLADENALAERDMLVLAVAGDRVSPVFGSMGSRPDAAALRAAYGLDAETPFALILLGKDGGEKLRRIEPVAAKDIFALIDSMPMRQSETKK